MRPEASAAIDRIESDSDSAPLDPDAFFVSRVQPANGVVCRFWLNSVPSVGYRQAGNELGTFLVPIPTFFFGTIAQADAADKASRAPHAWQCSGVDLTLPLIV